MLEQSSITVPEDVDWENFYQLYRQHHTQLAADVRAANLAHGSQSPDPKLELMSLEEFLNLATRQRKDVDAEEIRIRWLQRIARPSKEQFPWLFPEEQPKEQ
jgi:hypothetical protein